MTITRLLLATALFALPVVIGAQQAAPQTPIYQPGLNPDAIRKPLADSWPTYSGDYTGRRFSALTQVNRNTVKNLTLAWTARLSAGSPTGGRGGTPMIADHVFDLFFLAGDADRDREVGLADFNIFSQNFGRSGMTFTQGDFDYDGIVDLGDFTVLAQRYGRSV